MTEMKDMHLASRRIFVLKRFFLALSVLIIPALLLSQPAQGQKLPPLIDRELIFGDPEISGAQISPDGKFIAFIKPLDGTRNIWVKKTSEPFSKARPVTADTRRPIPGYFWSRDGKFILFVQDQAGDENYHVHAVNPAAKVPAGQKVPASRNLTDVKGVRAFIYAVPDSAPDTIFIGLNDRDASWHDLYEVSISTGERKLLRTNSERLTSWIFDTKDNLRLATRSAENGDTEVLRVDADGFTKVYSCTIFESCAPIRFHKDGKRAYMITNKGEADLVRLVLFDPVSQKEELVESDPMNRVDFGQALFSEVTDELVATTYEDDRSRVYFRDDAFEADYEFLTKRFPGMDISFGSGTKDERLWLIVASSDVEPGERYLFDRETRKLDLQYRVFDKVPREHLAPMKSIRYKSSDGLEIPAFLTLPKGIPPEKLALVVFPHGGPWARDAWGYDPAAQFLANRGYAVLQPNFRSSTGYGKKFLNAGNMEWGRKMQDDLTWGVRHLVATGVADPKRIGIMGGSYGGYATLAGLAFTPEVYAAGVSIVGPSNLITLLDSIPPYWEAVRKMFVERMGDPATPEGRATLARQSPLNAADKITAPLLVIQGANDPRVKKAESDQIVVSLRERNFPVEYLVAPDEGHGFARPVNNMAMWGMAEKFLATHLGGRHQKEMTSEVKARLAEITVDIKTVELPKKIEAAAVTVPKPAVDLSAGTFNYTASIAVGGQTIPMEVTSSVTEEGGTWVVTDTAKMPMGEMSDRTVITKGTLVPISRLISQGPVTITLDYKDGKASGTMTMNDQPKPIAADTGGVLFADGAGAHMVLASLPLADGFTTTFRNFDVQTQKTRLMQLKVLGSETVTVPAGTFDAHKFEVTSAEGEPGNTLVWVDKKTRKVVRSTATLPQMNGAVMTSELAK